MCGARTRVSSGPLFAFRGGPVRPRHPSPGDAGLAATCCCDVPAYCVGPLARSRPPWTAQLASSGPQGEKSSPARELCVGRRGPDLPRGSAGAGRSHTGTEHPPPGLRAPTPHGCRGAPLHSESLLGEATVGGTSRQGERGPGGPQSLPPGPPREAMQGGQAGGLPLSQQNSPLPCQSPPNVFSWWPRIGALVTPSQGEAPGTLSTPSPPPAPARGSEGPRGSPVPHSSPWVPGWTHSAG